MQQTAAAKVPSRTGRPQEPGYDFDEKNRRAASELIEFRSIQGQVIKNALYDFDH
jgi:hypothetical protein